MATYTRDTGELQPNQSVTLSIDIALQQPGRYRVNVDGLSDTLEVLPPYVPPYSLIIAGTQAISLYKRRIFQAEGNFFAFYTIGSRIWVASSPNGGPGTWTAFDLGIDCRDYNFYSVFYHPGYNVVDLVWEAQEIVYWTRGVPRRNGTIEWGQGYNTGLTSYSYGQNCIDTYGYPWIASAGKVTTSKRNDNEWVTQDGYPVQHVSYGINTFFASAAVPLANGHVVHVIGNYSVYGGGGGITFRRWDGFYWGSPVSGPGTGSNFQGFCGVGIGSKLHLTSVPSTKPTRSDYTIYDSQLNQVVYAQGSIADGAAAVTADNLGQVHLFWGAGAILRWRKLQIDGVWTVPTDLVTDPDGEINLVAAPYLCQDPWIYTGYVARSSLFKFKGLW
jgi:hypothetical protein